MSLLKWKLAALLATIAACSAPVAAQNGNPLNGFWEARYSGEGPGQFGDIFGKVGRAPLKPGVKPIERYKPAGAAYGKKLPVDGSACTIPQSFPFFMTSSPPFDIVIPKEKNSEILILAEWMDASRHIYMDERPHASTNPTRSGDSIGHWEGDTLVIDTRDFAGFAGIPGGGQRGPESHLVERYVPSADGQKLNVTFTWDDPTLLTKPFTYTLNYYKMPANTYALGHWCDPGDIVEYQSANGVVVLGTNANDALKKQDAGSR
jgi:hypothetical protein